MLEWTAEAGVRPELTLVVSEPPVIRLVAVPASSGDVVDESCACVDSPSRSGEADEPRL